MPELPEVETIARQLRDLVVDRTISGFESRWVRLTEPEPADVFAARLRGRRITGVRRRGKFVVFDLDGGEALVVSLRMTGKLLFAVEGVDERYVRGEIRFTDGTALRFSDTRKFGRMAVVDAAALEGNGQPDRARAPLHSSLGQEPLARGFTVAWLRSLLRRRPRAAIKPLLLDQRAIALAGEDPSAPESGVAAPGGHPAAARGDPLGASQGDPARRCVAPRLRRCSRAAWPHAA